MRDIIIKYKEISDEIIKCLKNDSIEMLNELLMQRDTCIEEMKKSNESKEKIASLIKEYQILDNDNKIKSMIFEAQKKVRLEMDNLNKEKNANSIYGNKFRDIYFINKQI